MNWALRVASGSDHGLGHIARSAALAAQMDAPVSVYLDPDCPQMTPLAVSNFKQVVEVQRNGLDALCSDVDAGVVDAVLFDGYDYDLPTVAGISKQVFAAAICDWDADMPVAARLMHGFIDPPRGRDAGGPEYALLQSRFAAAHDRAAGNERAKRSAVTRVLIGFGGLDSTNLTEIAVRAVELVGRQMTATVLLPEGAVHYDHISRIVRENDRITMAAAGTDPIDLYLDADIAIGAPGLSLLERCACGVPTLLVLQNDRQLGNGIEAERRGVARQLGTARSMTSELLVSELERLMSRPQDLADMRKQCLATVDGRGAVRAARWLQKSA